MSLFTRINRFSWHENGSGTYSLRGSAALSLPSLRTRTSWTLNIVKKSRTSVGALSQCVKLRDIPHWVYGINIC